MGGLPYEKQMMWRRTIADKFKECEDRFAVKVINPPEYYNPLDEDAYAVEREAMIWDLNQIKECDIVIVNLDGIEDSIGTHCELGYINAVNSFGNKHIYVIGFGNSPVENLHPWIQMNLFHWEPDITSTVDYICSHLLI